MNLSFFEEKNRGKIIANR